MLCSLPCLFLFLVVPGPSPLCVFPLCLLWGHLLDLGSTWIIQEALILRSVITSQRSFFYISSHYRLQDVDILYWGPPSNPLYTLKQSSFLINIEANIFMFFNIWNKKNYRKVGSVVQKPFLFFWDVVANMMPHNPHPLQCAFPANKDIFLLDHSALVKTRKLHWCRASSLLHSTIPFKFLQMFCYCFCSQRTY